MNKRTTVLGVFLGADKLENADMTNEWRTEYPKEPGYYWLRNYVFKSRKGSAEGRIRGPRLVQLDSDGDFCFPGIELVEFRHRVVSAEWFGPILPPEE